MEQILYTTLLGSGDSSKHFATSFYPLNIAAYGDTSGSDLTYSSFNTLDVDTDGTIYVSSAFGYGRGASNTWARGGLYKFSDDGRYLTTLDQWPADLSTKTSYTFGTFAVHEGKIHCGPIQTLKAATLSSYDASTGSAIASSYKYSTTTYSGYNQWGRFFLDKTNSIYYTVLYNTSGDYLISKAYLDPSVTTLIRKGQRASLFGGGLVVADSNGNMFLGGGDNGGGRIYAYNSSWTAIWGFRYQGSYDGSSSSRPGLSALHYMPETDTLVYCSAGDDAAGTSFLNGTGVVHAANGTPVWTGSHNYLGYACTSDELGNTYIAYRSRTNVNVDISYIVKVNPSGTVIWTNTISCGVTSLKYVDGDLLIYGFYIWDYSSSNTYRKYLTIMRVPSDGTKTGSFFSGKLVYASTTNWTYASYYTTSTDAGTSLSTNTTGDAMTQGTPGALAPQSSMYTDYRAL